MTSQVVIPSGKFWQVGATLSANRTEVQQKFSFPATSRWFHCRIECNEQNNRGTLGVYAELLLKTFARQNGRGVVAALDKIDIVLFQYTCCTCRPDWNIEHLPQ